MKKPAFCICENKDEDHDQRLCFRYKDSKIPLLAKSEVSSSCTARFVSDMTGNPEDKFSQDVARHTTQSKFQT